MSSNTDNTSTAAPYDDDLLSRKAASIHGKNLTKRYDTQQSSELVFKDLNFEIEPGSFVTLLGKSGSGKSTLLNIISDVIEPTEGRVYFKTEDDSDVTLGHVFQSPRLMPWDTVEENIEFVHPDNPDYSREVARQYLDLVGLEEYMDKYPSRLSGGQQQRVGIARALSTNPEVLLMDEPFSDLDEITAEQLRKQLIDIWQDLHKTIFFVTHNMTEAIQLSDRILMLGDGRLYADVEVPLDRPRNLDSDEFLQVRNKALEAFHSIDEEGEQTIEML